MASQPISVESSFSFISIHAAPVPIHTESHLILEGKQQTPLPDQPHLCKANFSQETRLSHMCDYGECFQTQSTHVP